MNTTLWVLQAVTALVYDASEVMKTFFFDKVREGVRSFDALPKSVWQALGMMELLCVAGLVLPGAIHHLPAVTVVAAALLAVESLVFIWVHAKYRETSTLAMSAGLGLLMLFIAYGRELLATTVLGCFNSETIALYEKATSCTLPLR